MKNDETTEGAKTVTVMVIHPNFKTVTVTLILGKLIQINNKTAVIILTRTVTSCMSWAFP